MAISPRFALTPAGDSEGAPHSVSCVYSFDLDGNIIEMNPALADALGLTPQQAGGLNLEQLLEQESWKHSRDLILMQLGGAGPQQVVLTAIASDGRHVPLEIVRRLLFERGRPVAA